MLAGCHSPQPQPSQTEPVVIRQIYDTGQFRVPVPTPWQVFPIEDPFAQGRPVKTDCVFLRKGGQSDRKVFEKPYVRISYYGPEVTMEHPQADGVVLRDPHCITPMQCGPLLWSGYTADEYRGDVCVGRFASLWAEQDGHKYEVLVCFRSGGETIALEDADLQAILSGLAPSQ